MTASDFASITLNGELCDETGQLGPKEFEAVMRKQIRHMAQSKLSLDALVGERTHEDLEFMQFGMLKMMFMEQTRAEQDTSEIKACLHSIMRRISAPMPVLGSFRRSAKPAETACPTPSISADQKDHREAVSTVEEPCTKTLLAVDSSFKSKQASSNPARNPAGEVEHSKSPERDSHHIDPTTSLPSVIDAVKDLQQDMEKDTIDDECSYAAELNLPESSDSQKDDSSTASPDEVFFTEDLPSPYTLTNLYCKARDKDSGMWGDEVGSGPSKVHISCEDTALPCLCEGDFTRSWKKVSISNDSNIHCSVRGSDERKPRRSSASNESLKSGVKSPTEPVTGLAPSRLCLHDFHKDEKRVTYGAVQVLRYSCRNGRTVALRESSSSSLSRSSEFQVLQDISCNDQHLACNCAEVALHSKAIHEGCCKLADNHNVMRYCDCSDCPSCCARIQASYDGDHHDSPLHMFDDQNLLPWPCSPKKSGYS